jgi:hypothetical protein
VLYVQGRPHVLRLFDRPLENVVTTGVAAAAVEGMEEALKSDVLNEITDRGGRILLHDEVEENGKFIVTAVVSRRKKLMAHQSRMLMRLITLFHFALRHNHI